jgi:hypothetical protein
MSSIVGHKKSRGRPPVDSERVVTRLPRDLVDVIDKVLAGESEPKLLSRPDVVRSIIRDWAIGNGYLPLPPNREDAN